MGFTRTLAAATLLFAVSAPAAFAQEAPIGVAACDDFINKYQTCVSTRVPEAQRAMFSGQITQLRASWRQLAANPQTRSSLEQACQQQSAAMRQSMQAYGCQF